MTMMQVWKFTQAPRTLTRVRGHDGFTLIEVLVSLVLFAIAILGIVGVFLTVVSAGAIGEGAATAFSLARACSESLQSQGYLYVTTFMNPADPCASPPGLANPITVPTLGRSYSLQATLTNLTATSVDIVVRASWTQRRVHSRTVATRLTAEAP